MRLHSIDYLLWCATPAVMIAIAAYMLRRRLRREFPFFFNYVVFEIAAFAIEFPLRNWANYYYVYWVTTALSILVSVGVVVEIVEKIVGRKKAQLNSNVVLLCWCVFATMAVAAVWALASGRGFGIDNITNIIYLVDRSVRVAACVVAVCMLLFGAAAGISKRNLAFGIAIGFGLFALVNMLVLIALSHSSFLTKRTLSRISSIAYLISMLIWLVYAAIAPKESSSSRSAGAA
jgi:hypothetical protein